MIYDEIRNPMPNYSTTARAQIIVSSILIKNINLLSQRCSLSDFQIRRVLCFQFPVFAFMKNVKNASIYKNANQRIRKQLLFARISAFCFCPKIFGISLEFADSLQKFIHFLLWRMRRTSRIFTSHDILRWDFKIFLLISLIQGSR